MGVTDPLAKVKEPLQSSLSLVRSNLTRSGRTLKVAPEPNETSNAPADSSKSDGSSTLSISMQIRGVGDRWSMTCANTLPTGAALMVRIDVLATLMDPLALPVNISLSLGLHRQDSSRPSAEAYKPLRPVLGLDELALWTRPSLQYRTSKPEMVGRSVLNCELSGGRSNYKKLVRPDLLLDVSRPSHQHCTLRKQDGREVSEGVPSPIPSLHARSGLRPIAWSSYTTPSRQSRAGGVTSPTNLRMLSSTTI